MNIMYRLVFYFFQFYYGPFHHSLFLNPFSTNSCANVNPEIPLSKITTSYITTLLIKIF